MSPEEFESIKQYVGFTDHSTERLREFHKIAEPHFGWIVDDFYATIQAHPDAVAAITGGDAQVARLKKTLIAWTHDVLTGPFDLDFLEKHSRIGRVHVRIELPQQFMFTAVNRIRTHLLRVADEHLDVGTTQHAEVKEAVNQILDLELAIMLDTYREDLIEKMRVRERLATMGQLAATIAHELRNPLGTVESSLYLMKRRLAKLDISDPSLDKHQDKISAQIRTCGVTIQNLLDLARERPVQRRPFDAGELVQSATEGIRIPEGVELEVDVPAGFTMEGDPDQLRQVVSNLVRNAVEALPDHRGTVCVEVRRGRGNKAELHVSDSGPGIPESVARRIFDVLFTTKASGTGLGLPLARLICEAHGGTLTLEPSKRGAHFKITIPQGKGDNDRS